MSWLSPTTWLHPPRSSAKELLDVPAIPVHDLQGNLEDMRRLNHCLGNRRLMLTVFRRLWRRAGQPKNWRILDIGTGAGDIPAAMTRWGQRHGIHLCTVAIDTHWEVVRYARATVQSNPTVAVLQADGLCMPFQNRSFDLVVCSTMLHHLSWHEGIALLRAMAAVTRYGLVVNDLVRSPLHHYGAKLLLSVLTRNHLTRHDGPLSVLRAYTRSEVRDMARAAGLLGAQVSTVLTYRLLLVYPPFTPRRRRWSGR
jgi:SAM-dependent methyltransferase